MAGEFCPDVPPLSIGSVELDVPEPPAAMLIPAVEINPAQASDKIENRTLVIEDLLVEKVNRKHLRLMTPPSLAGERQGPVCGMLDIT